MMCLSGLNMSVIQRLKSSWESLKPSDLASFNVVDQLMSPLANMRSYRETLAACETAGEPVIPYVAMYLRDVTYVFDGNSDFVGTINPSCPVNSLPFSTHFWRQLFDFFL